MSIDTSKCQRLHKAQSYYTSGVADVHFLQIVSKLQGTGKCYNTTKGDRYRQLRVQRFRIKEHRGASTVKSLGEGIFSGCTALTEAIVEAGNLTIPAHTFQGNSSLAKVTLKTAPLTGIVRGVIPNNMYLKEYVPDAPAAKLVRDSGIDPEKISVLAAFAFQGCTSLSGVELSSGLTEIRNSAFSGCTGLKDIALPKSLRTIGQSAFAGSGLLSLLLPEGTVTISRSAFYDCKSLKTVSFPSMLQSIYEYVFQNCTQLEAVEIPANVNLLCLDAVRHCKT